MGLLLCLETAVTNASVCLAAEQKIIALKQSADQRDSAAWLHVAIRDLLEENGITLAALSGVAVGEGPGSYTGLRVGMAAAKGLCYAAGLPLIAINTLQMMAAAAIEAPTPVLCPMIDARRMEVFTACYTHELQEILPFQPMVLEASSFSELLDRQQVTFFGNGSTKFQALTRHPNAFFQEITAHAGHLAGLAYQKLKRGDLADLAYTEPFYGKAFFNPRF